MAPVRRTTLFLLLPTLIALVSHDCGFVIAQDSTIRGFSGARVLCYTCDVDFSSDKYDANNSCLVGVGNKDTTSCSTNSNYCKASLCLAMPLRLSRVEVARLNGVLVAFSRKCADTCAHSCNEKGFGINRETCTYCCQKNPNCGESRRPVLI
ncbi:hypothetical protein BIW11_06355 [Tropilaelaps mercedesae]|uniref:Uncharacterized protein n=1 Tax=Tropilaelaps mercedesae TaxID=418985 RepID=A0A1V9XYI2_9ACAR|nr:hypothetical protein BIW11_06355 [Tropilaelaps mercedesae]